jgi:RNA polymerase sigma-70 factor (ECF subfamily)
VPASPGDDVLLRRHVDGDPDAFGELVRRHEGRLWAVALRTLGNPDDAADALQDGLLNAFRRAGSFRGDAAVTTWLHRIVVNACLDRVRRAAVRPTSPLTDDDDHSATLASADPDPAERASTRVDVQRALATLPAEQRVPLVLVDMEGYSVAEVAKLLGIPAGTVKSRCARARAKLLPLFASAHSEPRSADPSPAGRNPVTARSVSPPDDHNAPGVEPPARDETGRR